MSGFQKLFQIQELIGNRFLFGFFDQLLGVRQFFSFGNSGFHDTIPSRVDRLAQTRNATVDEDM